MIGIITIITLSAPGPLIIAPSKTPSGSSAIIAGTCPDGSAMIFDVNGMQGCALTTDTAPGDAIVHPVDNFPGGTQTASDLILRGGIDEKTITIDDYTNCAGDTVTVTIDGSDTVLTEGVDWDDATGNDETATSLAAAVDALTGVSSVSASAVVQITPDLTTFSISLAESDATCTTVAAGTDGVVAVKGAMTIEDTLSFDTFGSSSVIHLELEPDTGITSQSANEILFIANNTTRWLMDSGGGTDRLAASITNGPSMVREGSTSTNPTLLPAGENDTDSGLGWSGADAPSMIAGGVEMVRFVESSTDYVSYQVPLVHSQSTGTTVSEPFACAAGKEGATVYADDTDDNVTGMMCVCIGTGDDAGGTIDTWDWMRQDDNTSVCPLM